PKIGTYLARTSVAGGGNPSIAKLSEHLFKKRYCDLTLPQQKRVKARATQLFRWHNYHELDLVSAATCNKQTTRFSSDGAPLPCLACFKIQQDPTFICRISVKLPKPQNRKFTPKCYHSNKLNEIYRYHADLEELLSVSRLIRIQDPSDPFLTMARRASKGHFQDRKPFIGLIKAMLLKEEREQSSKKLKGIMKYSPEFDQFCHLLAITSPHAYRLVRQTFAGHHERSFRYVDS
ncbi:hypothetical protein BT69DRAFT_1191228, partial [Atractiella rhizophila]